MTRIRCEKCKLWETSKASRGGTFHASGIRGSGPKDAKIFLIGEAPGALEIVKGKPFVGPAGEVLNKCLKDAGLDRKNVRINNILACRPIKDRNPRASEIRACAERLDKEIKEVNPNILVLLGAVALRKFSDTDSITKVRGHLFYSSEFQVKYIPTIHPAYVCRFPDKASLLTQDLVKAKENSISKTYVSKKQDVKYFFCNTISRVNKLFIELAKQKIVAVDVETTGLDFTKDKLLGVSFSWKERTGVYLPLLGQQRKEIWTKEQFEYIHSKLQGFLTSSIPKVFHNSKFDLKMFRAIGIKTKKVVFDTLIAHYLLNENRGTHGLDDLAWAYTDMGGYEKELDEYLPSKATSYEVIPTDILSKYACADADCTFRLYNIFKPLIEKDFVFPFKEVLMPLLKVLERMEWDGVKIDMKYLNILSNRFGKRIQEIEHKLSSCPEVRQTEKKIGKKFNVRSPQQLRYLLYKVLGLRVLKRTKTGPSTDESVLKAFARKHEIPKLILDYRNDFKLNSVYVEGIKTLIDKNERVHTNYSPTGTVTGRAASNSPNLQNIPRGSEIRNLFVAEKGYKLVDIDYSSAEFRMFAQMCGDEKMIEDLMKKDYDIHRATAALVFGISEDKVTKEQRQIAKGTVFGLQYGRGVKSIAREFRISLEEAGKIVNIFFSKYPKAKRWMARTQAKAKREKQVRSFFGRVRRLPGVSSGENTVRAEALRQSINFPIQSGVADITFLAMIRIARMILRKKSKAKIVLTVHDSIALEVPDDELSEMMKVIKEEAEKLPKGINVPFPCEIKVGERWGDLKKVNV